MCYAAVLGNPAPGVAALRCLTCGEAASLDTAPGENALRFGRLVRSRRGGRGTRKREESEFGGVYACLGRLPRKSATRLPPVTDFGAPFSEPGTVAG